MSFSGLRGSLKTGDSERTSKEAIELHQELEIDIVALRSLAVGVPHMVTLQVDTCISTHTHNPVSEISSKRHRFDSGKKGEGASLRPLYIPHLEGNSTYPWLRCLCNGYPVLLACCRADADVEEFRLTGFQESWEVCEITLR